MYENLNQPFTIRGLTIKNRIAMSPMGIGFIYKPTGEITEAHGYGVKLIAQATLDVGRNYPSYAGPSDLPVHEMPDMTGSNCMRFTGATFSMNSPPATPITGPTNTAEVSRTDCASAKS